MKELAQNLRTAAEEIFSDDNAPDTAKTAARLTQCLARALERDFFSLDQVYTMFGAPGDWGYGTPIGQALQKLYKAGAGAEAPMKIEIELRGSTEATITIDGKTLVYGYRIADQCFAFRGGATDMELSNTIAGLLAIKVAGILPGLGQAHIPDENPITNACWEPWEQLSEEAALQVETNLARF